MLMTFEAGPVIPETEDKHGRRHGFRLCMGKGEPLNIGAAMHRSGGCKNCTQMVLGKNKCLQSC